MKSIGIVTDSHSGINGELAKKLGIKVLPMPFYFGEECYYEDKTITREEFFKKLQENDNVSTSQPAPADVMSIWDEALEEFEEIIYIPISSGLSGSCSTATALSMDEKYEGKVYVVDNGRVSTPLHRSVLDAIELIEEGFSAAKIKELLEKAKSDMVIYIGVQTLENLKKGGRITATTAALGTMLNIKPILKFDIGNLDTFQKCRGFAKAKKAMIDSIKKDLKERFAEQYKKGEVYLLAATSASVEETKAWIEQIKSEIPDLDVLCDPLSLGVACHIGTGALGIGLSCRPRR